MKQNILDEIIKYETIIIHRHVRPDPDAYGSQGALLKSLRLHFRRKRSLLSGRKKKHFIL